MKGQNTNTQSLIDNPQAPWYIGCFSFCFQPDELIDNDSPPSSPRSKPHCSLKQKQDNLSPKSEKTIQPHYQQRGKIGMILAELNQTQDNNISFLMNKKETFFCIRYNTRKKFFIKNPKDHSSIFEVANIGLTEMTYQDHVIAPLQVTKYIAQRCKTEGIVIDLCAQYGQHTVQQFEKECNLVIALETTSTYQLQQVVTAYRCQERVEILQVELQHLLINQFQAEVVFINFCMNKKQNNTKFEQVVMDSLKISKNLVFLVNSDFDLQVLVNILYIIGKKNPQQMQRIDRQFLVSTFHSNANKLQQTITLNIRQSILVRFRKQQSYTMLLQLSHSDEICSIGQSILRDGCEYENLDLSDAIYEILTKMVTQIGLFNLVEILMMAIKQINYPNNMLYEFLGRLIKQDLMNAQQIHKIVLSKRASHHHHNLTFKDKVTCFNCSFSKSTENSKGPLKQSSKWNKQAISYTESFQITKTAQQMSIPSSNDFKSSAYETHFVYDEQDSSVNNIQFLSNTDTKNKQLSIQKYEL